MTDYRELLERVLRYTLSYGLDDRQAAHTYRLLGMLGLRVDTLSITH